MWRDSFAVPRFVQQGTVRAPAVSIEDEFLLHLEKQANHMRRKDTGSFIPCDEEVKKTPWNTALLQHDEEEKADEDMDEHFELLSRTPMDTALPGVRDLFSEFDAGSEEEFKSIMNPLAPGSPAQKRKNGSLVTFLKVFQTEKDDEVRNRKQNINEDDEEKREEKSRGRLSKYNDYQVRLRQINEVEASQERYSTEPWSTSSAAAFDRPQSSKPELESGFDGDLYFNRAARARKSVERALKKSLSFVNLGTKKASE